MSVNNYVKPALTSLVYNVIQLVMTLIKLTCNIEPKIHLVGIRLRLITV